MFSGGRGCLTQNRRNAVHFSSVDYVDTLAMGLFIGMQLVFFCGEVDISDEVLYGWSSSSEESQKTNRSTSAVA